MAAKTFATYLSELTEATALGTGDRVPILESSTVKYVDGAELTPYLKYVALLSQSGTDAPTATVLENTLGGTVVWSYSDVGVYLATLANTFTENKTVCFFGNNLAYFYFFGKSAEIPGDDTLLLQTLDATATSTNELLSQTPIEIRVYP